MSGYRLLRSVEPRLDEIYLYTLDNWGEAQADQYINGLFDRFEAIVHNAFPWRPIPAEFKIDGYVCRYEKHFIYWKILADGTIGIVTILHERMHQIERFRDAFGE